MKRAPEEKNLLINILYALAIMIAVPLIIVIIIGIPVLLYISLQSTTYVEVGTYEIGYNKLFNKAAIYEVFWDGDKNNTVFSIPDEYNGISITNFAANYHHRTAFTYLRTQDDPYEFVYFNDFNENTEDEYETLTFTIKIGKNISEINHKTYNDYINNIEYQYDFILPEKLYLCGYSEKDYTDEDNYVHTLYKIVMYYEVSEENSTFYSVDGKIYSRETDKYINEYNYQDIKEIKDKVSEQYDSQSQ